MNIDKLNFLFHLSLLFFFCFLKLLSSLNELQMYNNIAKVHGISRENCMISLKRNEWQQPTDAFPPLHKRLMGQRRRRILGAFPETENDVNINC